jgi:hypothetical protein
VIRTTAVLLLFATLLPASYLAKLDIQPAERAAFLAEELPVLDNLGTTIILPLSQSQFASLESRGWQVSVLDTNAAPGDYFIIHKVGLGTGPIPGRVLWENERLRLVRLPELDARAAKAAGFPIVRLPLAPHPLPSPLAPLARFPYAPDTTIARIVSLVSQDSLTRTIRDLQDFGTRYTYGPKGESAAFYLGRRLTDIGYSVRLDTYYLESPTTRAFNVEATLEGLVAPESIIVACGHFDSYNANNHDDAPGADDNATGTAAVIELARVLRQAGYRWSVKFLCFSGEEQWMKGSYHWVDSTAVPESLKIAGAYNLDMFGYAAYDTNLVFINTNTASRPLANLCDSTNGWYGVGLRVMNYLDEDIYGDNTPFWEAGYLSVFALEDSEYGVWGGSNPYYHTAYDTLGNLTMSLVTRTTRMVAACMATLARGIQWTGMAEGTGPQNGGSKPEAAVIRSVLNLPGSLDPSITSCLLDVAGRSVLDLRPGANDVSGLAPGVYFVRGTDPGVSRRVVKVR